MVIYNQAGDVLLDIPVDDDSYRYRAIAQAKKVELRYSLVEHVELPTGAYIEYQGKVHAVVSLRFQEGGHEGLRLYRHLRRQRGDPEEVQIQVALR